MAFTNLKPQPPLLHPAAAAYAEDALRLGQATLNQVRYLPDLPYGNEDRRLLDLYLPNEQPKAPLPVLIFWHGGRWRAGYKEWNGFMAPAVCSLPAILVSPGYALSPEFRFPTPLHDCLAALAWTVANIENYGGDPGRIVLGGHSAGGHLAALATLRHDLYPQHGLHPTTVSCCCPVSGTMNLAFAEVKPGSEEQQVQSIVLSDLADAPAASPVRYVGNGNSAFLLARGENDFPRVISSGTEMLAALGQAGRHPQSLTLAGCDHFKTHLELQDPGHPWYEFLRRHLASSAVHR